MYITYVKTNSLHMYYKENTILYTTCEEQYPTFHTCREQYLAFGMCRRVAFLFLLMWRILTYGLHVENRSLDITLGKQQTKYHMWKKKESNTSDEEIISLHITCGEHKLLVKNSSLLITYVKTSSLDIPYGK